RFVHASDVQGPLSPVAAAYLARQRPTLLYLSGPPAYLESQLGAELVERGIDHLLRIIDQTGCRVILDHHALRDAAYPERFRRLWETGRGGPAPANLAGPAGPSGGAARGRGRGGRSPRCPLHPPRPRAAGGPPPAARPAVPL